MDLRPVLRTRPPDTLLPPVGRRRAEDRDSGPSIERTKLSVCLPGDLAPDGGLLNDDGSLIVVGGPAWRRRRATPRRPKSPAAAATPPLAYAMPSVPPVHGQALQSRTTHTDFVKRFQTRVSILRSRKRQSQGVAPRGIGFVSANVPVCIKRRTHAPAVDLAIGQLAWPGLRADADIQSLRRAPGPAAVIRSTRAFRSRRALYVPFRRRCLHNPAMGPRPPLRYGGDRNPNEQAEASCNEPR